MEKFENMYTKRVKNHIGRITLCATAYALSMGAIALSVASKYDDSRITFVDKETTINRELSNECGYAGTLKTYRDLLSLRWDDFVLERNDRVYEGVTATQILSLVGVGLPHKKRDDLRATNPCGSKEKGKSK